jgi:hypothetical protein
MLQILKLLFIIESLESQIKELTERSILLECRLNQSNCSSSKLPSNEYSVKTNPYPRSRSKKDGKRPVNQEGYRGETFDMVNDYDCPI